MRAASESRQELTTQKELILPAACGVALATLVPVALRQLHVLEHLPDPPFGVFDSDSVTGSKQAHPFGVPDSLLGLSSYAMTLALILLAQRSSPGANRSRLLPRLLGAKLLADGGAAAFNTARQIVTSRKLCSWCMGTVLATAVMVYAGRPFIAQLLPRAENH